MFQQGRKKGTWRFSFHPPQSDTKVSLAGDFNDWQPARMRKGKDGSFVSVIALQPGSYEYKFLVDGQWQVDGDNAAYAMNPYGSANSVAVVQ